MTIKIQIPALEDVFTNHDISAVLHFAGLKSVNESVRMPLTYYNNHMNGTITLLETMKKFGAELEKCVFLFKNLRKLKNL